LKRRRGAERRRGELKITFENSKRKEKKTIS
jgi:hypothetical protein